MILMVGSPEVPDYQRNRCAGLSFGAGYEPVWLLSGGLMLPNTTPSALKKSMGSGKMMVEFFSVAISVSVC